MTMLGAMVRSAKSETFPEFSKILAQITEVEARVGPLVYGNNDLYIGKSIGEYGDWCENELLMMSVFITPGDVIFDVGANLGHHSRAFSNMTGPTGSVVAFEPSAFNSLLFRCNALLAKHGNMQLINAAVSDTAGFGEMSPVDYNKSDNFGGTALVTGRGGEICPIVKLDDFGLLKPPSLIKIDVEGHEERAILGAIELIKRSSPVLFVEYERSDSYLGVAQLIHSLGYRVYLYESHAYRSDNFKNNPVDMWSGGGASLNMVCLPAGHGKAFQNLPVFDGNGGWSGDDTRRNFEDVIFTDAA